MFRIYIEELTKITELLTTTKDISKQDFDSAIGTLFALLFEIRAYNAIPAESEKVLAKLVSFQKNKLPLDSLLYSIECLIKLIAKSDKLQKQSNSAVISFITTIREMTDDEFEALIKKYSD